MGRSTQIWQSALVCCGVAAILSWNAVPLRAQSTSGSDLNGTQELNDIFNGNSEQGAASVFSLLNRIQLLNGRSSSDFAAEQQEGFQSAVDDFHKKQKEKLGTPNVSPQKNTSPVPVAPSSKP